MPYGSLLTQVFERFMYDTNLPPFFHVQIPSQIDLSGLLPLLERSENCVPIAPVNVVPANIVS